MCAGRMMMLGAVALLAACNTRSGPVQNSFLREAGSQIDSGIFGDANTVNVQIMSGQRRVAHGLAQRFASEVPSMVTFAFNSARLDAPARQVLQQQADWIRQFPEIRFRVYGHTDAVGSEPYNKRLGLRRANAVVAYLGTLGISRSRLEALVSFGETRPLIVTQSRERQNRRTVTEVSGFVQRHPGVLDGKYAQIIYRDYVASATAPSGLTGIKGSDLQTEQ